MTFSLIRKPPVTTAIDVARYFLALAIEDGDFISNLKMQKLVYYAYSWSLALDGRRLFEEPFEAWPNGPVVYPLYDRLKRYGSRPIDDDFLGDLSSSDDAAEKIRLTMPEDVVERLNGVYETYMRLSAFDLVVSTHNERPWKEARKGLQPGDPSNNRLRDEDILIEFSDKALA